MASLLHETLCRQFEISWSLAEYHLRDLTDAECLWRPASQGPHVSRDAQDRWLADWPEHEGYDLGPASIAWLTWHMIFWWSMVLDHSFEGGELQRESIAWPGSSAATRAAIEDCRRRWSDRLNRLTEEELAGSELAKWPTRDCPFADIVGWVNIELMKNASEIGYARFLYATRLAD